MFDPHLGRKVQDITIGFNNIFERFNDLFSEGGFRPQFEGRLKHIYKDNYPPYNIIEVSKYKYKIEMALAGFIKKDLKITCEDNALTIQTIARNAEDQDSLERGYAPESISNAGNESKDHPFYHRRGLGLRSFLRKFTLHDDVEVKKAELKDGMLVVLLEQIIPKGKEPKEIKIT